MSLAAPVGFPPALHGLSRRVDVAAGDTLFLAGTATQAVFFVVSGAVRLVRHGRDGEEVVLHEARAGEFFAEAALDSARYHCDAVVIEAGEVLKVPTRALRHLLVTDSAFALSWVQLLSRQLRAARIRVERLSLKSASARVRHLLHTEGQGPQGTLHWPGHLKDLARHLGLTHEALYRTLATLEREGLIEREGTVLRFKA
jgi:CRP-like cAMP-binding protein